MLMKLSLSKPTSSEKSQAKSEPKRSWQAVLEGSQNRQSPDFFNSFKTMDLCKFNHWKSRKFSRAE